MTGASKHSIGPGKTTYTFSVMFRFPLPPSGHLACYQQAGRVGQAETEWKYLGVSGKRICYFTPPPFKSLFSPLGQALKYQARVDLLGYNKLGWSRQV